MLAHKALLKNQVDVLWKMHSAIQNLMSWPKDITKKISEVECYVIEDRQNNLETLQTQHVRERDWDYFIF